MVLLRNIAYKSLTFRNFVKYFGILLLCGVLTGVLFINTAIRHLNSTMEMDIIGRLSLGVADLQEQKEIMEDISGLISISILYRPAYLRSAPLNEKELIRDFAKYSNYTALTDEYFFFYKGSNWVYKTKAKNTFDVYAHYILNLSSYEDLYSRLNSVQTFTVISQHSDQDYLFLAMPVSIEDSDPGTTGILCFVVKRSSILSRMQSIMGELNGNFSFYYNNEYLAGTSVASPNLLNYRFDSNGYGVPKQESDPDLLAVRSPDGLFTAVMEIPDGGFYNGMQFLQTLNSILIVLLLLFFLAMSLGIAYYSYMPFRKLAQRFADHFPIAQRPADELSQLEAMLQSALDKTQTTQMQLNDQYSLLKKQLLLILLNGDYSDSLWTRRNHPGTLFRGPYYCVFAIHAAAIPSEEFGDNLQSLLEDLSDEKNLFYATRLKYENCYAVLVSFEEEAFAEDALDMISAVGNAVNIRLSIGMGSVCMDLKKLPASLIVALSAMQYSQNATVQSQSGSQSSPENDLLNDDADLLQLTSALKNGNVREAAAVLDQIVAHMNAVSPTIMIRRCVYSNVLGAIIRVCHEKQIPVPEDTAGSIFLAEDTATFSQEAHILIETVCEKIRTDRLGRSNLLHKQILRYIEAHALEYSLSLDKLSDQFGITANHLSSVIKSHTGYSYKEYVTHIRIDEAKKALSSGELSVAEVSARVGYANISHFIQIFKKHTGLTPDSYKKTVNPEMKGKNR
jgi:YesN/AraC family two-component response regulator